MLSLRGQNYEARLHLGPGEYLWRGLKTGELEKAKQIRLKLLHEIEFKQQHGLVIQDRTLAEVIDEYVALRQRQHDRSGLKQKDENYTSVYLNVYVLRNSSSNSIRIQGTPKVASD